MRLFYCLLLFGCFSAVPAAAQPYGDADFYLLDSFAVDRIDPAERRLLDSLLTEYQQQTADTTRLKLLDYLVENIWDDVWIRYNDYMGRFARRVIEETEVLLVRQTAWRYTGKFLANRAYQHQVGGLADSATLYFERALDAQRRAKTAAELGYTYMSYGGFLSDQGDMIAAIANYEAAVPLLQRAGNDLGLGRLYYALCIPTIEFGDDTAVLDYGRRAVHHAGRAGDRGTVGATHSVLAMYQHRNGRQVEAAERTQLALQTIRGEPDLVNAAAIYQRAAQFYRNTKQADRARAHADTALYYARQVGALKESADALLLIAEAELRADRDDAAETYLREALAYADRLGYLKQRLGGRRLLARAAARKGAYREAYEELSTALSLKDSLVNSDRQKATLAQGVKFQYAQQKAVDDLENRQQLALADAEKRRQTQLFWIALAAALLAGMGALYIFGQFRTIRRQKTALDAAYAQLETRKRNELAVSNLKALQSQMNPHFIFNALNSVQDLVLLRDIRGSNRYLGMFSDLLRKILLASRKQFISLDEEIEMLTLYLELEQLRFGEEFSYAIESSVPPAAADHFRLPAMFIQPFVENALKHGLFHRRGPKRLTVNFSTEADYLVCTVEDNGIGQQRAAELAARRPDKHNGFSSEAARERAISS